MKKMLVVLMCFLSLQIKALDYKDQCEKDENSHEIAIEIKINCPMSIEFMNYVNSIPPAGNCSTNFEEWKSSFIQNMTQLMHLVESEKIFNSIWSVKTDNHLDDK